MAAVTLDERQRGILERVSRGLSVFFTGSAGTGKTLVLNEVIQALRAKYGQAFAKSVAVTAMTGVAATHVGGVTLNSALGLQAPAKYRDFLSMLRKNNAARIRGWKVLVIDECSMMSAEFFQMMEFMLRRVRRNSRAAGGLQLVICGDFLQLPPIVKSGQTLTPDAFTNYGYAFEAPAWRAAFTAEAHALLERVFRQSQAEFACALNEVRLGGNAALRAMRWITERCAEPVACAEGIQPTRLYARNADVDAINTRELASLPGEPSVFESLDEVISLGLGSLAETKKAAKEGKAGPFSSFACGTTQTQTQAPESAGKLSARAEEDRAALLRAAGDHLRACIVPPSLSLKPGAQVMLLRNLDVPNGLVNGSRGVVTRFMPKADAIAALRAAGPGHPLPPAAAEAVAAAQRFPGAELPVVRFMNGREQPIFPAVFGQEFDGLGECNRVQIPLKLAWTITIHKSQGMTLDAVEVSLAGMFAPGQAYVALSRARSMEGLRVTDWDGRMLAADPRVLDFHAAIRDLQRASHDPWTAFCERRWPEGSASSPPWTA